MIEESMRLSDTHNVQSLLADILYRERCLENIASGHTASRVAQHLERLLSPQGHTPLCVICAISRSVVDATYSRTFVELQEYHSSFVQSHGVDAYSRGYQVLRKELNNSPTFFTEHKKFEDYMFSSLCKDVADKWEAWKVRSNVQNSAELCAFRVFLKEAPLHRDREWTKQFDEWRAMLPEVAQRTHLMGLIGRRIRQLQVQSETGHLSRSEILLDIKNAILRRTENSFPLCFTDRECTAARSRFIANVKAMLAVQGLTYANVYDIVRMLSYDKIFSEMTLKEILKSLGKCQLNEVGFSEDKCMLAHAVAFLLTERLPTRSTSPLQGHLSGGVVGGGEDALKFLDVDDMLASLSMYIQSVAKTVRMDKR